MKLYLDTNIYLDYLLERTNLNEKDLSEYSYNIFKRSISCEFKIIISDLVLEELRKNIDPEKASFLFKLINNKLIKVKTIETDILESNKLSTYYPDSLHIILAKKANADLIITRNLKDFEHLFNSKLPEDI